MRTKSILALGALCATTALVAAPLQSTPADAGVNHQKSAQVELGRRLFLDETASNGNQFSCASCHDPEYSFTDRRVHSIDENGPSRRHSQTLLELRGEGFHWDGEFPKLENLLRARLGSPGEVLDNARFSIMAQWNASVDARLTLDQNDFNRRIQSLAPRYYGVDRPPPTRGPITPVAIANRIDDDGRYGVLFVKAYGTGKVTTDRMVDAMGAYMASLTATKSPYDSFRAGHTAALTPQQRRGFKLFKGKANCSSCHTTTGPGARALSDGKFHNTGIAYRQPASQWSPDPMALRRPSETGRTSQTFAKEHTARFKTPTLRDVALHPPYMHDGSIDSLREVVDYYAGGGTTNSHLDSEIKDVDLDEQEREDIVAFLHSLTGEERPGLGDLPVYRPDVTKITLKDVENQLVPELLVTVVPTGDRLRGTDEMPEPFVVSTTKRGVLAFPFPASTHVRLEADGVEIGLSRMLPDSIRKKALITTPRDKLSVRIRFAKTSHRTKVDELHVMPLTASRTSDARVIFKRVRNIGYTEALYVADREEALTELSGLLLDPDGVVTMSVNAGERGERVTFGRRLFDLSGGQCEPIDLRPDPPFDRRFKGPLGPGRRPPPPGGEPVGETDDDDDPTGGGGGGPLGGGGTPTPPDLKGGGGGLPNGGGGGLPKGPKDPLGR